MARIMKYLSAEHMVDILKQRALELEADLFAQVKERELGLKLKLNEVVAAAEKKIEMFETALADLDSQIDTLLKPNAPPKTPRSSRAKSDQK